MPRKIEYLWAVSIIENGERTVDGTILFGKREEARDYLRDFIEGKLFDKKKDAPKIIRVGVFHAPPSRKRWNKQHPDNEEKGGVNTAVKEGKEG